MQRTVTRRRTIEQADIDRFGAISGGTGRIHTDPEFARATRFGATLVQGVYLVALIEQHLCDVIPRWADAGSLEVKFVSPVKAGQLFTIDVEVDDQQPDEVRVEGRTPDGVAVTGWARVGRR